MAEGPRPIPVSEPAPAKVNLFLRVLGRRDDGFHEIETLILPVTLADGVRAAYREQGFGLAIAGERAGAVPGDAANLVVRAAEALARATGERRGARLMLAKRIPVAAGLGGGSADAAAALRALDRLWGWGLGTDRLVEVAAEVGSDVPSLVPGLPVLVSGRGERVERVDVPRSWWVLHAPSLEVPAADAYDWWDEDDGGTGPDPGVVIEAAKAGDVEGLANLVFNDLERPVARRHLEVVEATRTLLEAGALGALMCGSGPTVAGLCRDGAHAEQVGAASGGIVVSTITRLPA
jgi:4-diphosphocytidyl-2-C-methyl-D-erythritol kinase